MSNALNYNISFVDSGVGGLIFIIDIYEELSSFLLKVESEYFIKFNLFHIGDSKNSPYGLKSKNEIKAITNNLIHYTVDELKSNITVIACNTASTIFNDNYQNHISKNFPNTSIIPIIYDGALNLYNQTPITINKLTKIREINIGIFATKLTIESNVYKKTLESIHKIKYDKDGVKMNLLFYNPNSWVDQIESCELDGFYKKNIKNDLEKLFLKKPQILNIGALGLFCTHFPFLKKEISSSFSDHGVTNIRIITQGTFFAEKVINIIKDEINKGRLLKRSNSLNNNKKLPIYSNVTGDNINNMKIITKNINPLISKDIFYKKIIEIKDNNPL